MFLKKWLPNVITLLLAAVLILTQRVWAGPLADRLAAPAVASSRTTIAYQGYLTNATGSPVDGTLVVIFQLYNVANGGAALWSETQPAVPVTDGLFSVLLGSVTPLSSSLIASNSDLWLGITVGSDMEMAPRDKLASAPYAMMADVPDGSITQYKLGNDSVTSAKIVDGAVTNSDVDFNYAGSASKGGAATDVVCTGCVDGTDIQDAQVGSADVGFNYAGSTSKGGAATDLACTNCLSTSEIEDGQVATADLADNAVTSSKVADGSISASDVSFNYADSTGKGGAASDLACTNCVSNGEIADSQVTSRKFYPSAGHVSASFTDLNTTWLNVNNSTTSISLETPSRVLLVAHCNLQLNGLDESAEVRVIVNGVAMSPVITAGNAAPHGPGDLLYKWVGTVGMNYLINLGAGTHTLWLQAHTTAGGGHVWSCDYSYLVFALNP